MSLRSVWIVLLLFPLALLNGAAQKTHRALPHYRGPNALGPFSIDKDTAIRTLFTAVGMQSGIPRMDVYCFHDSKSGLYLNFRRSEHDAHGAESLMLSTMPNCLHHRLLEATIDPDVWTTPEGISIGSTPAEMHKAYGKADVEHDLQDGRWLPSIEGATEREQRRSQPGTVGFIYSCNSQISESCDDLRFAQAGFRNGKLIWINLSSSE